MVVQSLNAGGAFLKGNFEFYRVITLRPIRIWERYALSFLKMVMHDHTWWLFIKRSSTMLCFFLIWTADLRTATFQVVCLHARGCAVGLDMYFEIC